MGFYIRALTRKKESSAWKLQYVSYKRGDAPKSRADKPQRTWDIPRNRYGDLGFRVTMTIEQARAHRKQINTQIKLQRFEEKRRYFQEKSQLLQMVWDGYLPSYLTKEFEDTFIHNRRRVSTNNNRALQTQWHSAQKLLLDLKLNPADWIDHCFRFYDWFHERRYSFSYIKKILRMVNAWGYFLCRKQERPYYRIPVPSGYEKRRLFDAYFEKTNGIGLQSEPITPAQLEKAKSQLGTAHYNWLYLSVWLGLRPAEVDQLKLPENIQYLRDSKETPIISIYQSKLMSVPPRYRWKLIPLFLPEQKTAIKIIKSGGFERPRVYWIKKLFGPHKNLYAGRKGFTDLMLSFEQSMDHISQWMGHSNIQRTWTNYKNRLRVHYTHS